MQAALPSLLETSLELFWMYILLIQPFSPLF